MFLSRKMEINSHSEFFLNTCCSFIYSLNISSLGLSRSLWEEYKEYNQNQAFILFFCLSFFHYAEKAVLIWILSKNNTLTDHWRKES